ncbi:MAG: lysylphosphatidylglycerol synthase domain-containing protein, partial [Chitinophagaceae bacterium]
MSIFKNIQRRIYSGKFYWREILSVFFILVGFYFFRRERRELEQVKQALAQVHIIWLADGLFLTLIYIFLQSVMYVTSFAALGAKISFPSAVELYLKRNLIGIFLPAGGVTSQAFFKSIPEDQQVSNTKTNLASYIFLILGIVSLILVGIPVILFLVISKGSFGQEGYYFLALVLMVGMVLWGTYSIYSKGWVYHGLIRISPQLELIFQDILGEKILKSKILLTLGISVLIELVGVAQLFVAMKAVAPEVSLQAAFLGY